MFKKKDPLEKQVMILEAKVAELKGMITVKDAEIAFFKDRGDRYANLRDHIEKLTQENIKWSQEVLTKALDSTIVRITQPQPEKK